MNGEESTPRGTTPAVGGVEEPTDQPFYDIDGLEEDVNGAVGGVTPAGPVAPGAPSTPQPRTLGTPAFSGRGTPASRAGRGTPVAPEVGGVASAAAAGPPSPPRILDGWRPRFNPQTPSPLPRPPYFTPQPKRVRAYAIIVLAYERDSDRNVFEPEAHLIQNDFLTRNLRHELPPNFSEACTLYSSPARFIAFFGRRENNEGLTQDEAETISVALSIGAKRWSGHELEFIAQPIQVMEARRQVAQGLVNRGKSRRRTPPPPLSAPSETADSDDGQLVGNTPIPPDSSEDGAKPNRARSRSRRKSRGQKAGRSPAPGLLTPPASVAGSYDPETMPVDVPGLHPPGAARPRRAEPLPPQAAVRPLIPNLTALGQEYAGKFLIWKNIVEQHIGNVRTSTLRAAVSNSIINLPGASAITASATVENIIASLQKFYGIATTYDETLQSLYRIRQDAYESIDDYAARVIDRVQLVHSCFPTECPAALCDGMRRDRFFGGLRPNLKVALYYMRSTLANYTFDDLLGLVKGLEGSQDEETVRRPSADKSDTKAKPQKRFLRVKAAALQEPAATEEAPSLAESDYYDSPSEPENEVEAVESDSQREFRVRVAHMVDQFEKKKRKCFQCSSTEHLVRDCPKRGDFANTYLNAKGVPKSGGRKPPTQRHNQQSGKDGLKERK